MIKDIDHIIKLRRAIYPNMFTGKKLSKSLIEKVIENSNYAPTHKLTQPWLFKVYSNNSKKELSDEMVNLYKKKMQILKFKNSKN